MEGRAKRGLGAAGAVLWRGIFAARRGQRARPLTRRRRTSRERSEHLGEPLGHTFPVQRRKKCAMMGLFP